MHCQKTNDGRIEIDAGSLRAAIRTRGYVSGIAGNSFLDKKTGVVDPGFGLLIMDFLLAPGWRKDGYEREKALHGDLAKHLVEGPQICTGARQLEHEIISGPEHLAVRQWFTYNEPGDGYRGGSRWVQTLLFLPGVRYILACEAIENVNGLDCMSYRMDIPGHIKHDAGNTFHRIYLSFHGMIDAVDFLRNFPPDGRFHYLRDDGAVPERFIRAIQLREPGGQPGPWLAGMTLDPATPSEAWCHQRGYVCMIQENHGRPVTKGETIGAAYVLGYFDSIGEMEDIYDRFRGASQLRVDEEGYQLN